MVGKVVINNDVADLGVDSHTQTLQQGGHAL